VSDGCHRSENPCPDRLPRAGPPRRAAAARRDLGGRRRGRHRHSFRANADRSPVGTSAAGRGLARAGSGHGRLTESCLLPHGRGPQGHGTGAWRPEPDDRSL